MVDRDVMDGRKLYGDDFSPAQIAAWFEKEIDGYYNLGSAQDEAGEANYSYSDFNRFHAFDYLRSRKFKTCLAFGCASGHEILPISGCIDRIVAIEPARAWWRSEIGGVPTEYRSPTPEGLIDLPDGSVDLITCLGVLHHIPNVSTVLGDFARVLAPGGVAVIREPISSMGDWRKPRPGLTANERGIPVKWLDRELAKNGLRYERRRLCMFKPTYIAAKILRIKKPFNSRIINALDWIASEAFGWNDSYWRAGVFDRIAPTSVFVIAAKHQ